MEAPANRPFAPQISAVTLRAETTTSQGWIGSDVRASEARPRGRLGVRPSVTLVTPVSRSDPASLVCESRLGMSVRQRARTTSLSISHADVPERSRQ
jgi:hypothetical protein